MCRMFFTIKDLKKKIWIAYSRQNSCRLLLSSSSNRLNPFSFQKGWGGLGRRLSNTIVLTPTETASYYVTWLRLMVQKTPNRHKTPQRDQVPCQRTEICRWDKWLLRIHSFTLSDNSIMVHCGNGFNPHNLLWASKGKISVSRETQFLFNQFIIGRFRIHTSLFSMFLLTFCNLRVSISYRITRNSSTTANASLKQFQQHHSLYLGDYSRTAALDCISFSYSRCTPSVHS